MRTRFIGGTPSNWRDHGALATVATAIATPSEAVTRLRKRKSALDARLGPLAEKVKAGIADRKKISLLAKLGREARKVTDDLATAERAQEQNESATSAANRQQFEIVVAQGQAQRATFEKLFREACLALGEFCGSVDEAAALANSFAAAKLGTPPQYTNAVRALSANLNPLPAIANARPTLNFGWNLNFTVVPLVPVGRTR
ncbi:MAG: hypothetical protein ACREMY_00210 [bacterium]